MLEFKIEKVGPKTFFNRTLPVGKYLLQVKNKDIRACMEIAPVSLLLSLNIHLETSYAGAIRRRQKNTRAMESLLLTRNS